MTCRAHRGLEVTSETVRKTTHEFSNCQPQSSSHRLIVYAGQLFTWHRHPQLSQAQNIHFGGSLCVLGTNSRRQNRQEEEGWQRTLSRCVRTDPSRWY